MLVVGGDHDEPGKFKDALDLLRAMEELGHHFTEIGITGYPEGHPYISGDLLREALIQKQRYATYITTQMCFDVAAIEVWVRGTRADGVRLPVEIGIPGVVDPKKLAGIATRIGVGTSIRYLLKNRGFIRRSAATDHLQTQQAGFPTHPQGERSGPQWASHLHLQSGRANGRVAPADGRSVMVQSVERAFAVLAALAVAPAGITDLSSRVSLPKSTVARILSTLEELRAVERTAGGGYRIGLGLIQLAGAADGASLLQAAVAPHLADLAESLGEAAGFSVPNGYEVHYLAQVESPNPVQVRDYSGLKLPDAHRPLRALHDVALVG